MEVSVLGIRHHGPGSARSLGAALEQLRPDLVLIEGAPELDALLPFAGSRALVPPVAALLHVVDEPQRATFYPLAAFSPEWVAMRWALDAGVPVRFADLPATHSLAFDDRIEPPGPGGGPVDQDVDGQAGAGTDAGVGHPDQGPPASEPPMLDPIGALARAAGFDDAERWWEDVLEHRIGGAAVFPPVLDAMAELRRLDAEDEAATGDRAPFWIRQERESNRQREAAMRQRLRAAAGDGTAHVAFVCGAWHAPALTRSAWGSAAADTALLRGLPKRKVAATWVPWTARRLARRSGYGAGVTSPGWYAHLFDQVDDPVGSWLVRSARMLREEGLDASSASIIEATRLTSTLAAVRGRPVAGLTEVLDATETVLCGGSRVPLALVADRLVVGDGLGTVPDDVPRVPLAEDLARTAKRLRLKQAAAQKVLTLDLRTETDRARSALFHRLALLKVRWAVTTEGGRTTGTFKEVWSLTWDPVLELALVDASRHGTTVEDAASTAALSRVTGEEDEEQPSLGGLTTLLDACLLAELPVAVEACLAAVEARAAIGGDLDQLMDAVEPMAVIVRYGSVRNLDTSAVGAVLDGLVARVAIGLPGLVHGLDDDAAAALRTRIDAVHRAVALVDDDGQRSTWLDALDRVAELVGAHGAIAGRAVRLLLDAGRRTAGDARDALSRALSPGTDTMAGAAWLDGFLAGDSLLLMHDGPLLAAVDSWVAHVPEDRFVDVLALLRRTFSAFPKPERRQLAAAVRRLDGSGRASARPVTAVDDGDVDAHLAAAAVPLVALILGATLDGGPVPTREASHA
jgi:hypothetical protein